MLSPHLNWDDTRVFLAVARTGSLTKASTQLTSGIATISRRIERIEHALGVPLFIRHQTGYRLTDEGEALLPKAETLEEAANALNVKASKERDVAGRVKVATAENLATQLFIPALPQLLHSHPKLQLEITTDINLVNLHRRDADIAVRMVKPTHGHVTVRRLGTLGYGLYGSTDYMATHAISDDPKDFANHDFIGWTDTYSHLPSAQWIERALKGRLPILTTSRLAAQIHAAKAGLGLAVMPHFLGLNADLVRYPQELEFEQSIWLAIHADLVNSRRVRVVADFLTEVIHMHRKILAGH